MTISVAIEKKDLLVVQNLKTYFPVRSGVFQRVTAWVKAVDDVSFTVKEGETFGLVGESGCGKTTVSRSILRLIPANGGSVFFDGQDVFNLRGAELKALRRNMQIVFQDPYSSLDPRMLVGDIIAESLLIHGMKDRRQRNAIVQEMLAKVGLNPYHATATLTSSPADSVNASALRARWPSILVLSSATSRSLHSTSRFSRRF